MQSAGEQIISTLQKAVGEVTGLDIVPNLEHPKDEGHGDYFSNIAMALFRQVSKGEKVSKVSKGWRTPMELAKGIAEKLKAQGSKLKVVDRVEAVAPGFINFWISKEYLTTLMIYIISQATPEKDGYGSSERLENKKMMVEFAHPNTHKEMHIGHMRTLITGEALSRIFETLGAKVYRANYQGDIGPHVAKVMFGIQKILQGKGLTIDTVEKKSNKEKAHFLGEAYVRGNQEYEMHKTQIDGINAVLYRAISRHSGEGAKRRLQNLLTTERNKRDSGHGLASAEASAKASQNDESIIALYQLTRKWSLDYYDEFYKRFYTKFDRLFFESEMVLRGKEIVEKHLGTVFKRDQGAIVFKGEHYGLHTRVFVTQAGYPTYEGKEMGNAFEEYEAFKFDKKIHVVASEQKEYFQVVFKALELIDAEKFKDRQYHIPMGMVHLLDRKMSSRTGDVLTVDSLIDQVKGKVNSLVESGKIKKGRSEDVAEEVAIGAIKYSVLKVDTKQDVAFDIEKSVSLEGNSGPYLQYTFARTQSVLAKSQISNLKSQINFKFQISNFKLEPEEVALLRAIHRFPEIVGEAAESFSPNLLCNYLFDLSQKFNLFYQKVPIIKQTKSLGSNVNNLGGSKPGTVRYLAKPTTREFRLALTAAVGQVIKNGLYLLGIQAPERM